MADLSEQARHVDLCVWIVLLVLQLLLELPLRLFLSLAEGELEEVLRSSLFGRLLL